MKRADKYGLFVLSSLLIFGGVAAFGSKAYAESEKPEVDKSLGITYLKDSDDNIIGYDLHANDTIIKTVKKDGTTYYNFYLDLNGNGIVDGNETPASLKKLDSNRKETNEDTTDLSIGLNVNGAYGVTVNDSYSVTVDGVNIDNTTYSIYGANSCELYAPVVLDVYNSIYKGNGEIFALYLSKQTSTGDDTAVTYSIKDSSISNLTALYCSNVVSENDAVNMSVEGSGSYETLKTVRSGSSISGNVNLKIDMDDIDESTKSSFASIYHLCEGSTFKGSGNASIEINNVSVGSISFVRDGVSLPGSLEAVIDGTQITSSINLICNGGIIGGNANINIRNTETSYNDIKCLDAGTSVGGDLTIVADGVKSNYFDGLNAATVNGDFNIRVNESVLYGLRATQGTYSTAGSIGKSANITMTKSKIGKLWGICDTNVSKNVTITSDNDSEYAFNDNCFCVYSYNNYVSIGGDLDINIHNASKATSLYVMNGLAGGYVAGNYNLTSSGNFGGFYGMGSSNTSKSTRVNKNVKIQITDLIQPNNYSSIYGLYGGSYTSATMGGNLDITIDNVHAAANNSYVYIYGAYYPVASGNRCDVNISNSSAGYIYGMYNPVLGSNDNNPETNVSINNNTSRSSIAGIYGGSSSHIYGDISIEISNNTNTGTDGFYGIHWGYSDGELCTGNIDVVMTENETSGDMVSVYYGTIGGDVNVTASDNKMNNNSNSFYRIFSASESSIIKGNLTANISGCTLTSFHGAYCVIKGKTNINVENTSIGGYDVYPYQSNKYSEECGDVNVLFKGVTFADLVDSQGNPTDTNFYTRAATGQNVYVKYDETTILPNIIDWDQSVGDQDTSSVVTEVRSDDILICGNYDLTDDHLKDFTNVYIIGTTRELDKNVSFSNLDIRSSRIAIPEGKKLSVTNAFTMENTHIILEGTIEGTYVDGPPSDPYSSAETKAETMYFYMNGGRYSGIPSKANVLYPFTYSFNEMGGSVNVDADIKDISLRPDMSFIKVNDPVSIRAFPEEGYEIKKAKLTINGTETNMVENKYSSYTDYSFDMGEGLTHVEIEFIGGKISMGKTCFDPVAVVNQTYTEDGPLYDFDSLQISYDASKGDIKAELADGNTLPSGLQLVGNRKIIGKVTSKDETGKRVKFKVTSRNGVTEDVYLTIKSVSSGSNVEPSCEGMITKSDSDKTINLHGNSVYIEANGDETAFYIDENRDGISDISTPALSGDFSAYTVYGLEGGTTDRAVSFVMNGGNIAGYKALYKSTQTINNSALDSINIVVVNGNAGTITALHDSTTNAEIYVGLNDASNGSVVMTAGKSTNLSMQGYLKAIGGEATLMGSYHIKGDAAFNNLSLVRKDYDKYTTVYAVIAKNANVEVLNSVSLGAYCGLMVRGSLKADTRLYNESSRLVVAKEGSLDLKNNGNGVYYPLTYTSDLAQSELTPSGCLEIAVGDEPKQRYVASASYQGYSFTQPAGYTLSYRVNGGEIVELEPTNSSNVTAYITNEYAPMNIESFYTPTQIEITNRFSEARCTLNKAYTASIPVFDYTMLPITNDTTKAYAKNDKITYEIVDGTLPEGLVFENGKVYGTPSKLGSAKVDVKVTGYNGSSAVVSVEYAVDSNFVGEDINNLISLSSNSLNLNGNSVVMLPDPDDSSKVNIFLDQNHDGLADNTNAFLYAGSKSIDLRSCSVYGYQNTSAALDKDLSIYVYGGSISSLFGVYSGYASSPVEVNGDVSVSILGGSFSNYVTAAYNAKAETVTMNISGGAFRGNKSINVRGAYNPVDVGTVNFSFTGAAIFYYDSSYSYENYFCAATQDGNVNGDINVTVGSDKNGFSGSHTNFMGVYDTNVAGDVNYHVIGNFISGLQMYMVSHDSKVDGDLNVDWQKGIFSSSSSNSYCKTMVRASEVRDIKVNASVNLENSSYAMYPCFDSNVRNIIWEAPNTGTGMRTSLENGTMNLTGYGYMLNGKKLEIMGEYTLDKDFSGTTAKLYEGSNVTVPENLTLSATDKIIVRGILNNKGIIEYGNTFDIGDSSYAAKVTNTGAIRSENNNSITNISYSDAELINEGDINIKQLKSSGKIDNKAIGKLNIGKESILQSGSSFDNAGETHFNAKVNIYNHMNNQGLMVFNCPSTNTQGLSIYKNSDIYNDASGTIEIIASVNNAGKIYNYGKMTQIFANSTLARSLGTVFNSGELILSLTNLTLYANNSSIYYPIESDYPEVAFGGMTITETVTSGIDGDSNVYAKAGSTIKAKLTDPKTGFTYDSVETVALNDNPMAVSSADKDEFSGTMPFEPAFISVRMKVEDGKQIVISPSEKTVTGLKVGTSMTAIDLKSAITITGDDEEGTVKYAVTSANPLPKGLTLSNGVISGKPEEASDTAKTTKIVITGKNLSIAVLTITFDGIDKAVPSFSVPALSGSTGMKLSEVVLPYNSQGSYSWSSVESMDEVIDDKAISGEDFELIFAPNDTKNYDWSKVSAGQWDADNNVLKLNVKISLNVINPTYSVAGEVIASYGQKFSDVTIEVGEGSTPGHFEWRNPDDVFNTVGEFTYYAKFIPDDTSRYKIVNYVAITVTVKKAEKNAPLFDTFNAKNGDTLSDVTLPTSEEGRYVWIDSASAKVYKNKTYRIVFKPNDTANIRWLVPAGFDKAYYSDSYSGVVFEVTATGDDLVAESTSTPEVSPTKEPTAAPSEVPTSSPSAEPTSEPTTVPTSAPTETPAQPTPTPGAAPGTVLTPSDSKDKFKTVDSSALSADDEDPDEADEVSDDDIEGPFAVYTGPANKNVTSVTVPDTITVDGVTYKVIEISDSAFAGCKKLKKVVIGNNVRVIGKNAFSGCKSLATVTFKATSHVKNIKDNAFKGCVALKKITIPASVKYIRNNVFSGCTKLQTVTFAKKSKLRRIGKKAFFNCKSMKSMKLTSVKLKKVGSGAFKNAGKKSYKKFKISVPKAKKKAYAKLLKKGGLNKKSKVK